jgi:hypothetical protein
MMRLGSFVVAITFGAVLAAGSSAAQDAPRKLVAPIRGDALVQITQPNTVIKGNDVVTTIRVKNVASGPIAGFRIQENWFTKNKEALAGDQYRHPRPFIVDEIIEIVLTAPRSRVVGASNQYQFAHANGNIKTEVVKTLVVPKPAAKPPAKPPVKP